MTKARLVPKVLAFSLFSQLHYLGDWEAVINASVLGDHSLVAALLNASAAVLGVHLPVSFGSLIFPLFEVWSVCGGMARSVSPILHYTQARTCYPHKYPAGRHETHSIQVRRKVQLDRLNQSIRQAPLGRRGRETQRPHFVCSFASRRFGRFRVLARTTRSER